MGEGSGWRGTHDSAVNRTSFGFAALFAAVAAVAGRSWDSVLAWRCLRIFSSARWRGRAAQGLARTAAARRSRAVFMMPTNWPIHAAGRNVGEDIDQSRKPVGSGFPLPHNALVEGSDYPNNLPRSSPPPTITTSTSSIPPNSSSISRNLPLA